MHVAFVNSQGNFDPKDFYWTAHPDFGGQLVYVKELALAMGNLGHKVDIVTRRIVDPDWPEFASVSSASPADPIRSWPKRSSGPISAPSSCRACSSSTRAKDLCPTPSRPTTATEDSAQL
jgi:hypothetical protein